MRRLSALDSTQSGLVGSTNGSYSAAMSDQLGKTPEPPQPPPVSLKELSEAFAEAVGGRAASQAETEEVTPGQTADGQAEGEEDAAWEPSEGPPIVGLAPDDDDSCQISPQTILEAMLFVGNPQGEPLTPARAAELMRGVEPEEIPLLVDQLNRRYRASNCPYEIISQGLGYRIALRKSYAGLRNLFRGRQREAQLSQAAVDVLAIVAYRQPLAGEQVSKLRGRPSGQLLAQLVRRQLLRVERTDQQPRKTLYRTTDRFLHLFGLESIEDLPQAEDLQKR